MYHPLLMPLSIRHQLPQPSASLFSFVLITPVSIILVGILYSAGVFCILLPTCGVRLACPAIDVTNNLTHLTPTILVADTNVCFIISVLCEKDKGAKDQGAKIGHSRKSFFGAALFNDAAGTELAELHGPHHGFGGKIFALVSIL